MPKPLSVTETMKIRMNQGFTLVELIIVIAILGLLATAALAVLDPFTQFQKANDAKRKADLSQIQKALEVYYQDYGEYPDTYPQSPSKNGTILYPIVTLGAPPALPVRAQKTWGSSWQPYMNVIPSDPVSTKHYVYYTPALPSSDNRQSYYLYASLDRGTKDLQACSGVNGVCSEPELSSINMQTACGGVCNFGLTSPDKTP
jgi:prepilin-type N-terminal cleavage/methylation domain-containing protein